MKPTLLAAILLILTNQPTKMALAHGGGLNSEGCHNNRSTGGYHCHRGSGSRGKGSTGPTTASQDESYYNTLLAVQLGGQTEVNLNYSYGLQGNAPLQGTVRIDIVTDEFAIEGGKDKRSSLDSIQQAVFAASLMGKKPAVAIYDTDNHWGKYEHRIWRASQELGVKFIWVSGGQIHEP